MSIETFIERLKSYLRCDLELVINENRWTMLNLLEKRATFARLSCHKMFLEAPDPVISAIAHYVRGSRKESSVLRQYIQDHLSKSDYTHQVKQHLLVDQGCTYQLRPLYEAINKKYFNQELNLSITWYGRKTRKRTRTRITFGQYVSGLRLIKIHRMLDHPFFPEYFVCFIIYHEMLHSIVDGKMDERGRYCYHSAAFKEREKAFEEYHRAIEWEKKNKTLLFKYGWT